MIKTRKNKFHKLITFKPKLTNQKTGRTFRKPELSLAEIVEDYYHKKYYNDKELADRTFGEYLEIIEWHMKDLGDEKSRVL